MADSWYALTSSNISGLEEGNFNGDKGRFVELINSFMGKAVQDSPNLDQFSPASAGFFYRNSRKTPAFRHGDIRLQVPQDMREFTLGESM